MFDVAAQRIINAHGTPDVFGGGANFFHFAGEDEAFNFSFNLVVELVAVGAEKFDAVVRVRIVRGGDDDAGVRAQTARDVGDARRRQRSDKKNIHAHRKDAG